MKIIKLTSNSLEDTIQIGKQIALSLKAGSGILFTGDLGTGKTTLISGICAGLGIKHRVKSPTFILSWLYPGDPAVYHVDLYRIDHYEELENIGWEEMTAQENIYLVEWAEKFPLPYTKNAVRIFIEYGESPNTREIEIHYDEKIYYHMQDHLIEYSSSK